MQLWFHANLKGSGDYLTKKSYDSSILGIP